MNNKFIKVHQTNLRFRYKYFLLKEKFIELHNLIAKDNLSKFYEKLIK